MIFVLRLRWVRAMFLLFINQSELPVSKPPPLSSGFQSPATDLMGLVGAAFPSAVFLYIHSFPRVSCDVPSPPHALTFSKAAFLLLNLIFCTVASGQQTTVVPPIKCRPLGAPEATRLPPLHQAREKRGAPLSLSPLLLFVRESHERAGVPMPLPRGKA